MRVLELILTNYRGFGDTVKFPFSEHFTVIAGVNGRGKTSILDGLALLFSHLLPQISEARKRSRKFTASDVFFEASETTLSVRANCAGIPIKYNIGINKGDGMIPQQLIPRVAREIKNAYGDPSRADDQAPLAVYYTTDRAGYRFPKALPQIEMSSQAMAYTGALFNRVVDYRDFMARFRVVISLADDQIRENGSFLGYYAVKAINQAIEYFLDGFTGLEVRENPLKLIVRKNDEVLDLRQLSDGERSLIALICDLGRRLALANPALENPLEGAGVVLIDELELHLHPKWQREVKDKLRKTFPNIQFIATTHSPFIIQSLNEGELINLNPEEFAEYADESIEDISEFIMGVEMPQKSKRYLEMMQAAEEYYKLLHEVKDKTQVEIENAKQKLNELSAPFSDDPAFQALLNFERNSKLKE